jgi:fructuronate reductase
VSARLSLASLSQASTDVERPDYGVAGLGVGIVHLGLGAFHRAHQAVFTEDAIRAAGGDWGIVGV